MSADPPRLKLTRGPALAQSSLANFVESAGEPAAKRPKASDASDAPHERKHAAQQAARVVSKTP